MRAVMLLATAASALSGCAAVDIPVPGTTVSLVNSSGQVIGSVSPAQTSGGVSLLVRASGLPHGLHGVHVHSVGRCDPASFESAGAHWNPATGQHGFNNPRGPHTGDLPNIAASSSGVARETVVLAGTSLAQLADADGSALVIHAAADDYATDPSGNSGGRIACAVLAGPRAAVPAGGG